MSNSTKSFFRQANDASELLIVSVRKFQFTVVALGFLVLPISPISAVNAEPNHSQAKVRSAIERSIPYLEEKGMEWIRDKKCVSCHRVGNMVWSLTEARSIGFKTSEKLDDWIEWSLTASLKKNEKGEVVGLGNKEGVAQLILGLDDLAAKKRRDLLDLLKQEQEPNGSWKPGGQLPTQKRLPGETREASTMWIALALQNHAPSAFEKALHHLDEPLGKSTEWIALKLLIARQTKNSLSWKRFARLLIEKQNKDGGWGWLTSEQSDALGTGIALYALRLADSESNLTSMLKAQEFLLSNQKKDGSWDVRSTKGKKREFIEETSSYWGTAWAILGLIKGLKNPDRESSQKN